MKRALIVLSFLTMVLTLIPISVYAHSGHELDQFVEDWQERSLPGGVTYEELQEFVDMMERHPWYADQTPRPSFSMNSPKTLTSPSPNSNTNTSTNMGGGNSEQWRPLVAAYFPTDQLDMAICIIRYESGGNPQADNPRSSARGLFQVLASLWAPHYGVDPTALYDPETNTRIAADIWRNYGWGAWSAARKC